MHMQGEPRTMQRNPRYDDVAADVAAFLEERLAFAVAAGIGEERICLDPGIGFGKTVAQNFELVCATRRAARPRPARSSSASRGSRRWAAFSAILARPPDRSPRLLQRRSNAYERGATIIRAHDVRSTWRRSPSLRRLRRDRQRVVIAKLVVRGA